MRDALAIPGWLKNFHLVIDTETLAEIKAQLGSDVATAGAEMASGSQLTLYESQT